ncbi:hypothetical protein L1987_14819 [Smallanthus sonchifolius]|uniref:Uncharacterized protein n=1 Tax=Smallanthus sonchifolius TaxID=185202 RepID=A0ACB9J4W9_9ASTR|nr:hypothetical protein L1987_14819 [Smallanthus sonchifolius]
MGAIVGEQEVEANVEVKVNVEVERNIRRSLNERRLKKRHERQAPQGLRLRDESETKKGDQLFEKPDNGDNREDDREREITELRTTILTQQKNEHGYSGSSGLKETETLDMENEEEEGDKDVEEDVECANDEEPKKRDNKDKDKDQGVMEKVAQEGSKSKPVYETTADGKTVEDIEGM